MKLSVLVCTVTSRVNTYLPRIILELQRQIDLVSTKDIEILYLGDNKSRSIGSKRNDLLNIAKGDYICFVDDDDLVTDNFISTIFPELDGLTDIICYGVAISLNGQSLKPVYYSKDFKEDSDHPDHYKRIPNHLMVTKRELAVKIGYKDLYWGEDVDYSKRLLPNIKTQKILNSFLYHYIANINTTVAQIR